MSNRTSSPGHDIGCRSIFGLFVLILILHSGCDSGPTLSEADADLRPSMLERVSEELLGMEFQTAEGVPLGVRALDESGRPVPNLGIHWEVLEGQGVLMEDTSITDMHGIATILYRPEDGVAEHAIRASANGVSSAEFRLQTGTGASGTSGPAAVEDIIRCPQLNVICIANVDGSAVAPLVRGYQPAWSPDGRHIAFQRDGHIKVIDVDGLHEISLARGSDPDWSPDGSRIVYRDEHGISVMNRDGTGATMLVTNGFRPEAYGPADMGVGQPTWAPDGAWIAFQHLGDGYFLPSQVFLVTPDGSIIRRVTPTDGVQYAEARPAWEPDGSMLIFWRYGSGMVVSGLDGGEPTPFYDGPDADYYSDPVWSPDGSVVAFTAHSRTSAEIRLLDSRGESARPLVLNAHHAAWSPDGTRIAFVSGQPYRSDEERQEEDQGAFPPASGTSTVYERAAPHSNPEGALSRFVLHVDGTFQLQYVTQNGFRAWEGTYLQSGVQIDFMFDAESAAGDWHARGTLHDDVLQIRYNAVMALSDFEDGMYVRASEAPTSTGIESLPTTSGVRTEDSL